MCKKEKKIELREEDSPSLIFISRFFPRGQNFFSPLSKTLKLRLKIDSRQNWRKFLESNKFWKNIFEWAQWSSPDFRPKGCWFSSRYYQILDQYWRIQLPFWRNLVPSMISSSWKWINLSGNWLYKQNSCVLSLSFFSTILRLQHLISVVSVKCFTCVCDQ